MKCSHPKNDEDVAKVPFQKKVNRATKNQKWTTGKTLSTQRAILLLKGMACRDAIIAMHNQHIQTKSNAQEKQFADENKSKVI
jgi:hypothetical protein